MSETCPPLGVCPDCKSGESLTVTLTDDRRWCCACGKYVDLVPAPTPEPEHEETWRDRPPLL